MTFLCECRIHHGSNGYNNQWYLKYKILNTMLKSCIYMEVSTNDAKVCIQEKYIYLKYDINYMGRAHFITLLALYFAREI